MVRFEEPQQTPRRPQRVDPAQRDGGGIADRDLVAGYGGLDEAGIVGQLRFDDFALREDLDLMGAAAEELGQDAHFGSRAKAEIAGNRPMLAEGRSLVRGNESDSHSTSVYRFLAVSAGDQFCP